MLQYIFVVVSLEQVPMRNTRDSRGTGDHRVKFALHVVALKIQRGRVPLSGGPDPVAMQGDSVAACEKQDRRGWCELRYTGSTDWGSTLHNINALRCPTLATSGAIKERGTSILSSRFRCFLFVTTHCRRGATGCRQ